MRMLGSRASIDTFRWDLIYLAAQLFADKRPEVAGLGPQAQALLDQVNAERSSVEQAEDTVIFANAMLNKSDRVRDVLLIQAGGVARSLDKAVYSVLFPNRAPSIVARMSIEGESKEIRRILGELAKLPDDHTLRLTYEKELTEAEAAVTDASKKNDDASTAAALARSQMERFKVTVDKGRLEIHAQLVIILKDKAEADLFFRPTSKAPITVVEPVPVAPPEPKPASVPVAVPA